MEHYFKSLCVSLRNNAPNLAIQSISHIYNVFSEDLEENEIDANMVVLFDDSSGLLAFVNQAAKDKTFEKSVSKALEVLYILLHNFSSYLTSHMSAIITSCKFICDVKISAFVKQKAIQIFNLMLTSEDVILDAGSVERIYVLANSKLQTKASDTVTSEWAIIFGKLTRQYPTMVKGREVLLRTMINMIPGGNTNLALSEGLLLAINDIMHCTELDDADKEKLYVKLERLSNHECFDKKVASRAALQVFTEHITKFEKLMRPNAVKWNNQLRSWVKLGGENFKAAAKALDTFYLQLTKIFADVERDKGTFDELMQCFRKDIEERNVPSNQRRLSIRGYGYFANIAGTFLKSSEIQSTFLTLLQDLENNYVKEKFPSPESMENLPDYVLTLSYYTKQVNELSAVHISCLQKITVTLIKLFPKLSTYHHGLALEAFIMNLYAIETSKSCNLEQFLNIVVDQGVMWTCSHYTAKEVEMLSSTNEHHITYKSYLPLWVGVFGMVQSEKQKKYNLEESVCKRILDVFVDTLMKVFFILVNKLNINVKNKHDLVQLTDPSSSFEAVKVNDFVIFVNLADFFVDLLEEGNPVLFHKWLVKFNTHVIEKTQKYPLVSGFYKLLAANLKVCDKLSYFTEARLRQEHVASCFESLKVFIRDTTLKLQHTSDDLQMSCMLVVLAAPVCLIKAVHADFAIAFISVFTVGRNYLPIAKEGVNALNRWYKAFPKDKSDVLLRKVLPSLDYYLQTRSLSTRVENQTSNSSRRGFRKRQVVVEKETELLNLQKDILKLLAKMNSEICWEFINANSNVSSIAWNKDPSLKVSLAEDNISIHLDKFLPRLLQLSQYSSDRITRGHACELLHSTITIMLGKYSHVGAVCVDKNILEKVFGAALNLGCDGDTTIRNMYNPLVRHMIHWYSSPKLLGSKETHIVLKVLFDKISQGSNAKMCDLSAICIKEFVAWTIKQSKNQKALKLNSVNIDEVIDKVKYFSTHPDPAKRLGGALMFNSIHAELREQDLLINKYWLVLLHTFIHSLSTSQMHFSNEEYLVQVNLALDHLLRVFVQRSASFNTAARDEDRTTPQNFTGNTLKDVAIFLLKNTASINGNCRKKCLEMFSKIAPLVRGCKEADIIKGERNLFFSSFEHDLSRKTDLFKLDGPEEALKWLGSLLCLLDGHIFAMQRKNVPNYDFECSRLNQLLQIVLKNLEKFESFATLLPNAVITSDLKESYSYYRKHLIEKIYRITMVQLENHCSSTSYFNDNLWEFLYKFMFSYYTRDAEEQSNLLEMNKKLVILLEERLPEQIHNGYFQLVTIKLSKKLGQSYSSDEIVPQSYRQILRSIICYGSPKIQLSLNFVDNFFKQWIQTDSSNMNFLTALSPSYFEYCDLKLQIALQNNAELNLLTNYLCDQRYAKCLSSFKYERYGWLIFKNFSNTITTVVSCLENFETFLSVILTNLNPRYAYDYVDEIVKHIERNLSKFNEETRKYVVSVICNVWCKLAEEFSSNCRDVMRGINLIESMAFVVGHVDSSEVLEWVLELLNARYCSTREELFEQINRTVYILGFVARKGSDSLLKIALQEMKQGNSDWFGLDSSIVATTLLIKASFEAANFSKSISILSFGIDMSITAKNNFHDNVDSMYVEFFNGLQLDLQLETLQEVFLMCSSNEYNYLEKMKIGQNLCRMLHCCEYRSFEDFFVENILQLIEDFGGSLDYTRKLLSSLLVSALFARVDLDKMEDKNCPITAKACAVKTGRELLKKLFIMLVNVCKQPCPNNPDEFEIFRLYQCQAYNALISIVCCCKKDNIGFYNKLFYRADNSGDDILWQKLVDCSLNFNFSPEVDEIPKKRKVLVGIRTEFHDRSGDPHKKSKYIESQHLFQSSLQEDITRYDFTNVHARTQPLGNEEMETKQQRYQEMQIELTEEDINQHECMSSLCGLIKHMAENNLLLGDDDAPPQWIRDLRKLLLSNATHVNVKYFLAKMISNTQEFLKVYGKWLMGPIIGIIQSFKEINSFVIDMVVMFLTSWLEVEVLPEENEAPSNLVKYLMQHLYSENSEILRYNVTMLGMVVERWKNNLTVPCDLILEKLSVPSKSVIVGVHIVNILLVNDIAPWDNTMKDFSKKMVAVLERREKRIYGCAAETIGLVLKFTEDSEEHGKNLDNVKKLVLKKLKSISDEAILVHCLEAMAKHYPEICEDFSYKLLTIINGEDNINYLSVCLRIILKCFESFNEKHGIHTVDTDSLLSNPSLDIQVVLLELISKSVDFITAPNMKNIVKCVSKFVTHKNRVCRDTMYTILMSVYKKYCLSDDELCVDIVGLCQDVLLQGLSENELEIREKLYQFWLRNEQLPSGIDKKVLYVLKEMYKPSNENIYLMYASCMLLGNLKSDLDVPIFEGPLQDCEFTDYELSTYWKDRYQSMMPLFATTLSSQKGNEDVLRATQTLQFEPTLTNTIATQRATFTDTNESFLFRTRPTFKDPNETNISNAYKIVARRFNKDRSSVSKFHASREIKKADSRRKMHAEAVKRRENNICVYRQYRDGDLPDIQISLSAVILPLQSLAKHDHQIARLLFSSLFETSLEITSRSDAFIENSTAAINFIFNNSMFYNPSLIGALMDIALSYKDSIKFRPEIISRICQGSGLISTGCLLLEEYIISMPGDVEPPRKKIKSEIPAEDEDTLHWVKLAELYKAMEDWDVVRSIFLYKMQCPENVIKAIKDESSGYFKNASETYSALIQEDVDLNRKDFYYESFFKCLAELSAWSKLETSIKAFVSSDASDPWSQLWEDEWNREKLLPHYINAQIRLENYEYLQNKFNEDLQMADRTEYLKNNNSGELAFLGIFDKNFSNSRNFLNIYMTSFLSDWSYINPLFSLLRMQRLMSARSTFDIGFFTENYEKMDVEPNLEVILHEIQCLWERNQEENFVSIMETETRNLYRKQFVSLFERRLDEMGAFDKFHILDKLKNGFDANLMEVALNRGSYYVAKKCMQNNKAKIKNRGNAEEYVSWNLLCSMLFHLNSRMFDDDEKKVEINCKSMTFLDNCMNNDHLKENRQLFLKASLHRFELTSEIYKISHNNNEVNNFLRDKDLPLGDDLENLGVQSLLTCLETCKKDESKAMLKKIADCFCKLAHYMLAKGKGFEKDFMLYTFRAMKYESEDAIMLFPYLLTIENLLDEEITGLFLQQSSDLPTWLYLKWIPQLLAYLDTDKIRAISDIVLRIAKEYPNSIIYSYKIAKERYSFGTAGDQILLQRICNELDTVLNNSTVDLMLSALSSVCTPGVMVKTAADQLRKANSVSEEKFRMVGEIILKSLYGENYDYYNDNCVRGRIFKNVDKHKKAFEEILKGKYDKKKLDDKLQALRRLEDKMEPGMLSHYSPWLANFYPNDYDEEIEIPGQYRGDGRPLLQYHVKLAGFSSEVKVLSSLRRPIKITMLGNNAKEYEFLLKYGEDLRQDQRIEQLFTVMNKILKSDSNCCQRKLSIMTYEVIPLTTNVGIIEWVGETEKLGDFILNSLDSKATKKLLPELSDGYSNWMKKVSRNKNSSDAELYAYAMLKHDRDQACSNYKSLVQKIPPYLLRSSFRKISMDTESFFALRDDFIKSYAVMCISNWLLGIGDRHLSNILISLIDGRPIGIDFGHAFGTGTELPVPELVPFRLTPQIVNLMQPHYEHGALQESMVHALKALQKRKDVLLAMMDVFIREPTMNWLEHVEEKNEASVSWYPQQKISLAKQKLDGANPSLVMAEEIQNRKNDNAALSNKYLEHVKGVPGSNFRAGECKTVDDQVKCLLDQAMDPNLLGRMYQGWMPWM